MTVRSENFLDRTVSIERNGMSDPSEPWRHGRMDPGGQNAGGKNPYEDLARAQRARDAERQRELEARNREIAERVRDNPEEITQRANRALSQAREEARQNRSIERGRESLERTPPGQEYYQPGMTPEQWRQEATDRLRAMNDERRQVIERLAREKEASDRIRADRLERAHEVIHNAVSREGREVDPDPRAAHGTPEHTRALADWMAMSGLSASDIANRLLMDKSGAGPLVRMAKERAEQEKDRIREERERQDRERPARGQEKTRGRAEEGRDREDRGRERD